MTFEWSFAFNISVVSNTFYAITARVSELRLDVMFVVHLLVRKIRSVW